MIQTEKMTKSNQIHIYCVFKTELSCLFDGDEIKTLIAPMKSGAYKSIFLTYLSRGRLKMLISSDAAQTESLT